MKWFFGIALLLLAALLLDAGLMAYALYVLLGVLVVSRFLARNCLANLSATRSCRHVERVKRALQESGADLTAEIGERITVQVTVKNSAWMVVPWVLLEDLLPRQALDRRTPQLKVKGKRLQIGLIRGGGE